MQGVDKTYAGRAMSTVFVNLYPMFMNMRNNCISSDGPQSNYMFWNKYYYPGHNILSFIYIKWIRAIVFHEK